jgi:hypothetical protein
MTSTLQVGLNPASEHHEPVHTLLLDIVSTAEDLGYQVQAISTSSLVLHWQDIAIEVSGYGISGETLRRLLRGVR